MKKIDNRVLLFLILFEILPFSSGNAGGVCISQGGRFPPFLSEGKPPRQASKGPKDLALCRVFRKKTCCSVVETHPALLSIRRLALTGEASKECLQLWELLECSICDPSVGLQPGPPLICNSFCDRVFQECSGAYFSMDAKTQVLAPCGVNDFVCGRASEWVSNGTELCRAAGFAVQVSGDRYVDRDERYCYGGKTSLDSISKSWRRSSSEIPKNSENLGSLADFQQWARDMPFRERVSWAVAGMVLTAGLLFVSKRKSHSQRQKQAALQRVARRLEEKNHKFSASRGNRKGNEQ